MDRAGGGEERLLVHLELAYEITQEDVNNGLKGLRGDWWLVSNPGDRREYSGQIVDGGNFRFSFYTDKPNLDILGDFTGSDASAEGLDGNLANLNGCVAPAHATK